MATASQLRAGAAAADITPPIGVTLAGSLTRREAASVLDPLHARCVVLESGGTRIAFVLLELIALDNADTARVREVVARAGGMPVENVCVSCVHTHTGPCTLTFFQSEREAAFVAAMTAHCGDAARLAVKNMKPARAAWGNGWEPRAAFNRRYHMRDGTLKTNPGYANPQVIRPAGPTDPQIPILLIESTAGEPIAVIANFSLHYIGDHDMRAISADYFGCFARIMQERKGKQFVALLTHGASGDINNVDVFHKPGPRQPQEQSNRVAGWVADQVDAVWSKATFQAGVPVGATQSIYNERIRKPKGAEIEEARKQSEDAKLPLLDRLYAKEQLELLKWPEEVPMVIQALRVGDWGAGTSPGEIFCRFGLDLKNASPFPVTALIELANGYGGYIPTRVDYELGGYETRLARSAFAAPFTGEEMVAVAAMGLRKLFKG